MAQGQYPRKFRSTRPGRSRHACFHILPRRGNFARIRGQGSSTASAPTRSIAIYTRKANKNFAKGFLSLGSTRRNLSESARRLKESADMSTFDLQALHPLTEKAARLMSKVRTYVLCSSRVRHVTRTLLDVQIFLQQHRNTSFYMTPSRAKKTKMVALRGTCTGVNEQGQKREGKRK